MKELYDGSIRLRNNSSFWEDNNYRFYWEGLIFIKGIPSGIESLELFSDILNNTGIEKACSSLSGVFFLTIYDKDDEKYYSLVDNSGLFQAFYSEGHISTSFLNLVEKENLKVSDFNKRCVVEFVHLGNIYFNRTFFDAIKKIDGTQVLSLSQTNGLNILKKDIQDIFSDGEPDSFLTIFEKIATSLKNHGHISIDLTSGMDSRLCAVIFKHFGLEFETAVSGFEGHRDVDYSYRVAQTLGTKHFVTHPSMNNIIETIEDVFNVCDGLQAVTSNIRLFQLQKERKDRNVDLMITATGGEILRDYFWVQDYPLYNRKHSNLKRLFNLRYRPIEPDHSFFSDGYIQHSKNLRDDFLSDLSLLLKDTNTKTYDNIYFYNKLKEFSGRFVTNHNCLVKCYAPLLDIDIVRIAVNLPVKKRLFGNFHHEIMASLNPEVAKLKYPTKVYLGLLRYSFFLRDFIAYFTAIKRKLVHLVQLRSANIPSQYEQLKKSNLTQKYTEILHTAGIINNEVELASIDNDFLGQFLTLAMLIERIQ